MTATIKAKNVEVYMAKIDNLSSFDPSSRGNDKTLLAYVDDAAGSSVISNWTKISTPLTEVTIEPADDDTETRNYFGSTSDGAQNSVTETVTKSDIDITLSTDAEIQDLLTDFALSDTGLTHTTYTDYKSYNLGSKNTNDMLLFIRIKRQISGTYYFRNVLIVNPEFKKAPTGVSGSADDSVLTTEWTLLGNKSSAYLDFYSGSSDESVSNITL